MKYQIFLLVAICTILLPHQTFAQTSTEPTTLEEPEVVSTNATSTTPDMTPPSVRTGVIELTPRTQERIRNLAANLSNRIDATIARLQNISVRLQSRSAKIAATGANTTNADAAISNANRSLEQAERIITSIDEQIAQVIGGENPGDQWLSARFSYRATNTLIRDAHTDLSAALTFLKNPPLIPAEPVATTTEEVTI